MTLETLTAVRQHISRLGQRAGRLNFDSLPVIIFRCDQRGSATAAELNPNVEELSQSTVIAFIEAITMTAWSSGRA
jgi:hypothetical protein